jgi:mannose-6-phosphate isomerase-like protein (cupin superfamily)
MSTHSWRDVHNQVTLYAIGALPADEAREFETHLGGCELCRNELESFARVSDEVAVATAGAPPPSLRGRVIERIADDRLAGGRLALDGDAMQFVRSGAIPWERGAIPGVEFKLLHRDPDRACSTKIVRLAPGIVFPSHRHGGVEELFVIQGEALISGVLMRAGDYCRAEPGTVHIDISTRTGVLFFGVSSDRDEALD